MLILKKKEKNWKKNPNIENNFLNQKLFSKLKQYFNTLINMHLTHFKSWKALRLRRRRRNVFLENKKHFLICSNQT